MLANKFSDVCTPPPSVNTRSSGAGELYLLLLLTNVWYCQFFCYVDILLCVSWYLLLFSFAFPRWHWWHLLYFHYKNHHIILFQLICFQLNYLILIKELVPDCRVSHNLWQIKELMSGPMINKVWLEELIQQLSLSCNLINTSTNTYSTVSRFL